MSLSLQRFPWSLAVVLAVGFLAGRPAGAADSAGGVDGILERFVAASGGKAALEKVTSRHLLGELQVMGTSSPTNWQMFGKAPNRQFSQFEIAGFGVLTEGFDGTVAWAKSPTDGVRSKAGDELARTRREATLHRELQFKTLYPDLVAKGTATVDGEEVRVLESKPSATSLERFSFSVATGLLVQQHSEFMTEQGQVVVVSRMRDHRAVQGVKYAHEQQIKISSGGQDFEVTLKLQEVRQNVAVPDAKFAKPSA